MAQFDALAVLREAGHPVDLLTDAQREVFARLGQTEVLVLNSLKRELDSVAAEVEGQEVKIL